MGRAPCCEKSGLKKGPWTPEEDHKLIDYISKNGYGNWRTLPMNAGLERCGKSCRLRWTNYLRPDIKRGRFSLEEEENIIQLHSILGNKWSAIAGRLPGRTDNEIKNYWNTHIRKKLVRMGIDPVTHSPRLDLFDQLSSICMYDHHNNQTASSRLMMDMHQSSASPVTYPDNQLLATNFYSQTTLSSDPFDPTRMIQNNQYYNYDDTQHEVDHQDQSLIQIQAFQKQAAEYELQSARFQSKVVSTSLANLSHVPIPFTHFYSGSNQNQILNNSVVLGHNLSMNNSVISTPSSSPNSNVIYNMNSSCISTEDEKEIHNNRIDYYFNNDLVKMINFEIPDHQIFDISMNSSSY